MRLVVSKRSDIALRALKILAGARGAVVSGAVLTAGLGSGSAQLSQVMSPLVARGWVTSRTGPDGGYALSPELERLSMLEVVEAVEGPVRGVDCVLSGRTCGADDPCAFHETWAAARESLRDSLARVSAI